MRLLLLTDGINGVVYHRIATPHLRMQIDGLCEVDVCQLTNEFLDINFKQYDLVIFSRWLGDKHYDVLKKLAQQEVKFLVDVDDYWALPRYNPAYKAYRNGIKQAVKDAMYYADGVIVTTPHLAIKAKEFNKRVFVIPNCIDYEHEQWSQPKTESETIRIGWVGGVSHYEDLKLCNTAINELQKKYEFEFYVCGYTGGEEWEKMIQLFDNPKIVQGTNTFEYGQAYRHFDFVIAPLLDESFNNHKSELKIIEAASYQLPIITSACFPYLNCEGNNGVIFSKENEWYASIETLLTCGDNLRQQMGRENREYCDRIFDLRKWNKERLSIYKSV